MIAEVIVVGEGTTEETFVRDVLAQMLAERRVMLQARLIPTSKYGRGGALKWDRIRPYLRNTLRERNNVYVTTFFDLYKLNGDFPGKAEAAGIQDPRQRAQIIEEAFARAVVQEADCRPERFLPHIQPYEFEALLFSDVTQFGAVEPEWQKNVPRLLEIRNAAATPEHINDGSETHPSARLQTVLKPPRYEKVLHGVLLAEGIGLQRIQAECQHFAAWVQRLQQLAPPQEEEVS